MRFLPEVEMAHDRVFEKVKHGIAEQDEERSLSADRVDAFRDELQEHQSEDKSRPECEEIFLHPLRPRLPHDNERSAENLGERGHQSEKDDGKGHRTRHLLTG